VAEKRGSTAGFKESEQMYVQNMLPKSRFWGEPNQWLLFNISNVFLVFLKTFHGNDILPFYLLSNNGLVQGCSKNIY
jgi:hypothetical protein